MLVRLVDDAAVFPPGNAPLPDALSAHRKHRSSWYADLVGPLLVKSAELSDLVDQTDPMELLGVGLIADGGVAGVDQALGQLPRSGHVLVRQVEVAVAKRGEDPLPGLSELIEAAARWRQDRSEPPDVYAEIPLTWGCVEALNRLETWGGGVMPKFRTGGLAAELFPTPDELASVMVACAERGLRFKLTAGLHHAVRHLDRSTGFTHHGFLNILAASVVAERGEIVPTVAGVLAETEPAPLVALMHPWLDAERPLWIGYGSCSIDEPLHDLLALGLLEPGPLEPGPDSKESS